MSDLSSTSSVPTQHTPEQIQRIAANKARALERLKAKRKADEQPNRQESQKPKKARWIKPFYEFDLSRMEDSKGGFIVEETAEDAKKELAKKKENSYVIQPYYPPSMDPAENPKCKECGSMDLDPVFFNVFHMPLCPTCKEKYPEKYSLITKTEAKEDYLLTDPELKDQELLPHWSKPNPHKSTWNDMMLYVREMVEEYAFKKWNGPEGLDAEYERRVAQKKEKKDKKFKEKLADLRRRTLTSNWERKRQEGPHKHEFETHDNDTEKCKICGLVIESEEL
ncbi:DNA repair protein rad14 [Cokeromyces recurvatus]|uniref:DNA repair protein rad14 n=1 Tax=Cokeromyces recurvatus TaxID=90255 RepID=UPI00221FA85F|nr:DNA repair protein rad14 [Cokeromyces recurvatus]KAI7905623.1 DNA repair protein rad14 [Cokeromyces recurvatus]